MNNDNLLAFVGFSRDNQKPYITYSVGTRFVTREFNFGDEITIEFNTKQRFCVGTLDVLNGGREVCEFHERVDHKYDQCKRCQIKTGFNPAFYNTDSVSEVQQELNSRPHFLYIAYFSDNDIKVGISNAERGISRLLEQGARDAIILETFSSANIARKYEADITKLPYMCDNVKLGRKFDLMAYDYDKNHAKEKLEAIKSSIQNDLKTEFKDSRYLNLDEKFFAPDFDPNDIREAVNIQDQEKIAGKIVAFIGQIMICQYDDFLLALPMKKFTGYYFTLDNGITTKIELNAQQSSLF